MNTTSTRYAFQIIIVFLVMLYGCRNHTISQRAVTAPHEVAVVPPLLIPIDTLDLAYAGLNRKKTIAAFYRTLNSQPAWSKAGVPGAQADTLIAFLGQAGYYSLPASRYHMTELNSLAPDSSTSARQRFDLLLTDAYLRLSHDLRHGLLALPSGYKADSVNLEALKNVFHHGGIVSSLQSQEPAFGAYHALKACLKILLDSGAAYTPYIQQRNEKLEKIAVNMERWRQEARPWVARHVVVNIPSYQLYVIDNSDTVLTSRVIVGNPEHPTPALSSIIRYFTIYPYWVVPRKISVEEYLPVIQKDTTFFTRTDFEVLDGKGNLLDPKQIPWRTFHKNNFPVVLRQQDGIGNALGLIKFSFDNPYAVFLHDTNAKQLFKRNARAFSHGCIRVEKAAAIARYLMTGSPDKESALVKKYLDEARQAVISIQRPLPIYVRYFTAEVIKDTLSINADIYGKDVPFSIQLREMESRGAL